MHTVLSAGRDTEALVVEMGMNHAGEIGALSHAVCPDVALITNVGTAHIGNLGSRKAIAAAKLEIRDGMRDGVLIIPYGEPLLKVENGAKTLSVDCEGGDYSLYIGSSSKTEGKFSFRGGGLVLENERVALPDRHQLLSLGYAIAIAEILGIESERIRAAIKTLDASILRQRYLTVGGYRIYDDTYSSSAEAAIAVMDALTKRHREGASAVLGDMLELGEKSEELHRKVGRAAAECGIQRLYLFGEFAERIAEGALMGGMPEECIFTSRDVRDLRPTAEQIKGTYSGEVLIVKASHALHAERLYDLLKE